MKKWMNGLFFPFIGLASLVWFLVRVIPKPSRAKYPCMRAAAPIASSFVLYVAGLLSTMLVFKKARRFLIESRYVLFSITLVAGFVLALATQIQQSERAHAVVLSTLEGANQPMGEGKGIFPGRVAWIYDPDATDAACANTAGDYWYQDDNTSQTVVNSMLSKGLQMITGETTDAAAWSAVFRNYNQAHGKGNVGYKAGEQIVIKINLNGQNNYPTQPNINTSPQICYAVLNQLINVVGVAQSDIGIGDPGTSMGNVHWDKCHSAFPNVKYWGQGSGRTPAVKSKSNVWFASDGGMQDPLPQFYLDAAYMINIPVFKKHHRAGVSLCSKNHFGSISGYNSNGAFNWHYSLPCPNGGADVSNGGYGVYRCFVDIMGHRDLGGKTVLYLIDGIWGSTNWGHPAVKWRMAPFNNDWPSSIFLSQDPVAVESVGFDFLYNEFDPSHPTEGKYDPGDNHGPFSRYAGADDFMHQAADSKNWPEGFKYDPENDGTPLPASMGTHEHWNNATDKKYTRNLGGGTGVELVSNVQPSGGVNRNTGANAGAGSFTLDQNYPNPFNPSTRIGYHLSEVSDVSVRLTDATGRIIRTFSVGRRDAGSYEVQWDGLTDGGHPAPSGVYCVQMTAKSGGQTFSRSGKMALCR
jgi:hypothetical protein